jgi:ubiquinone/menaquinone biosynthesis C-methylase UbiE/uncharacterized protein YbaR (Trm112 family)
MMNEKINNYICCPKCQGNLLLGNFAVCENCQLDYKIINDIPVLIDSSDFNDHLKQQVDYFEKEMIDKFVDYKLDDWQKNYVKRFFSNNENVCNKMILDCGTGSGYMAIELAKAGAQVFACDLTLKNLLKLKNAADKLGINNIYFVCCSADRLPFKDNIFDHFITNAVLEHLAKEGEAIAEINRVTKNEASLMIAVPISYKYLNPLFLLINFLHDQRIGHLRRYNENILQAKFFNWKLLKTYYTGHTAKVFKTLVNICSDIFNCADIEIQDSLKEDKKMFSSNIICFFRKCRSILGEF